MNQVQVSSSSFRFQELLTVFFGLATVTLAPPFFDPPSSPGVPTKSLRLLLKCFQFKILPSDALLGDQFLIWFTLGTPLPNKSLLDTHSTNFESIIFIRFIRRPNVSLILFLFVDPTVPPNSINFDQQCYPASREIFDRI